MLSNLQVLFFFLSRARIPFQPLFFSWRHSINLTDTSWSERWAGPYGLTDSVYACLLSSDVSHRIFIPSRRRRLKKTSKFDGARTWILSKSAASFFFFFLWAPLAWENSKWIRNRCVTQEAAVLFSLFSKFGNGAVVLGNALRSGAVVQLPTRGNLISSSKIDRGIWD